ncbi:MAG: hypothetical protein HZB55_05970 [Deltaproteobacteria bacterium]|nr:hypothetical protein [Deltaproteobacteria bacterium]
MDQILLRPLREIDAPEDLAELFDVLPDKHVERLFIIKKMEELRDRARGAARKRIEDLLERMQPERQRSAVLAALQVPWGDWSRVYRVRGLFRAIQFVEETLTESEPNPNILYNLAFLYYIAYSFLRDEGGQKNRKYRDRALELAEQAKWLYKNEQVGRLEHFLTFMGSMIISEWRKNLPQYCTSLACNIVSLIHLLDEEYEQALASINESFESHPTPPEIYFSMAIYLLRKGAFNPAIRFLNESIKKKGEHSAETYYQLGRAYYVKARHFLGQLDPLPADDPTSLRLRKALQGAVDRRVEKAIVAFEASVGEDPYFALAYYWMGVSYLARRSCGCERAGDMIRFAAELDPKTVSRYLQERPLACRSPNRACDRRRLRTLLEA